MQGQNQNLICKIPVKIGKTPGSEGRLGSLLLLKHSGTLILFALNNEFIGLIMAS